MYIRKVLFTTKLVLVLILAYVVVKTVALPQRLGKTLAPTSAQAQYRTQTIEMTDSPNLSFEDCAQIVKRNPFSNSNQITNSGRQTLAVNSSGSELSVSEELGLALFGTVSGNPEVARAIIKDLKTGVVDLYKTRQAVGDAHIERIDADMVILLHNGERKTLRFNTESSGNNSDNNIQAPLSRNAEKTDTAVKTDLSTPNAAPAIQTKIGYVEAILKKAVIEPYKVDGNVEGLKITGLENMKVAQWLGLKNGDIIHKVNGHQLTSKQKAYQVFKKARAESNISFELSRNGQMKKLSLDLR